MRENHGWWVHYQITWLTASRRRRSVGIVRTEELLRRIHGLDRATLDACEGAGWVSPGRMTAGGDDARWWTDGDLYKLRDIVRQRRAGLALEDAYRRAAEDRFFGLCPCDWRITT